MSEEIKHWAEKLQTGDRCIATIRHKTDGSKNIHNAKIIVMVNYTHVSKISAWYNDKRVSVPYNELSEIKPVLKDGDHAGMAM